MRRGLIGLVVLLGAACGGSDSGSGSNGGQVTTTSAAPTGFVITIAGLAYTPLDLKVPPGATVTVVNNDGMPHSVTSEASKGSYKPAAVAGISFDTGQFSSGQRTFTIPASATAGTVVPYYCTAHLATMATPNGSITIDPTATPPTTTPPPPAAPSGGY